MTRIPQQHQKQNKQMVPKFPWILFIQWLVISRMTVAPPFMVYAGSRLIVRFPESVRQVSPQGFSHQEAMFGQRLHGVSIVGPLYYADGDFCNPQTTTSANFATTQYYPTLPFSSPVPFLLLVNRTGDCNFVRKVRNAQQIGAAGVIFADHTCVCSDTRCLNETEGKGVPCQRREPIMPNDGSGGHDITIPSFLLWKRDADLFKRAIVEGNLTIRVEMQFPPRIEPDSSRPGGYLQEPSTLSMEMWMNPTNIVSQDIIARFQPAALAFQQHLNFTLHTYIMDGVKNGCQAPSPQAQDPFDESYCDRLCTNQGRYCAVDPDLGCLKGVSGADVVKESLRQLCIWSQPDPSLWWNYAKSFYETCFHSEKFQSEECVQQVYKEVGIESRVIANCMKDSGGLMTPGTNNKFENELELQQHYSIHIMPTLYINGMPFEASLTADALFHRVCNNFKFSSLPKDAKERKLCYVCGSLECTDFSGCIANDGICPDFLTREASSVQINNVNNANYNNAVAGGGDSGVSVMTFFSSLVLVVALTVGLAAWHHQRSRSSLRGQVRDMVSDYMLISDNEEDDNQEAQSGLEMAHENDSSLAGGSPPSSTSDA
ncbi:hypothetical protein ACA910_019476 [Epithemia clementina (nom. ined.)]